MNIDTKDLELIGHFWVDSGQAMVGDPCYLDDWINYGGRLNDEGYGTRIIISQMIGESWTSSTGWGLSVDELLDNEHKIPVLDFKEQTVSLQEALYLDGETEPIFTMGFDAFIKKFGKGLARVG